MLKLLCIKDFAIVDKLELEFSPGMTVLTGETGAGKSIIIGALSLVLGGRAGADVIRAGSDSAEVSATMSLGSGEIRDRLVARMKEQDIPFDDEDLLIRRIISKSGRNKIYLNGTLVTAAVLSQITSSLIDITGQHEHVWLLQPDTQMELLDAFANLMTLRADVSTQFEKTKDAHEELRRLKQGEQDLLAKEDFLKFQVKELKELAPVPGEEAKLMTDRKKLSGAERLKVAVGHAEESLYSGEHAAVETVGAIKESLTQLADADEAVAVLARSLGDAQSIIEDVSRALQKLLGKIQVDPEKLAALEDRLESLKRLSRKHGCTVDTLVAKAAELEKELHAITHREEKTKQLERDVADGKKRLGELCFELSDKRKKAALRLAHAALEELATLGMDRAGLQVAVEMLPARGDTGDLFLEMTDGPPRRVSKQGVDRVEVRIAPNPGEEMKPLAKIASGGELSRVLLALKRVLAQKDPVPVYVFDEVDAGVGGAVGEAVGLKIRGVSQLRQALCVTHLAQIAAQADHHMVVEKVVEDGRTLSKIRKLGGQERVDELARMLGGMTITDATRVHAKDLLKVARGAPA